MGNFIIDTRIKKLERIKQNLLTLKKSKRGDELTQVNQMINRLKGWNIELQNATKDQSIKDPKPN
jgi:primosomal protein N''